MSSPCRQLGEWGGYIEALTPLGRLAAANQEFQLILLVLGATSLAAALVGSWTIAGRALRPIDRMTGTARADAGSTLKRRPVDLDPIVLDAFREARHLSEGQTLSLSGFEPARIEGDEDRLKQLLLILLDNALKYTPVEGQITMSLERQAVDAVVIVQDTGVGIPPGDLPHVFERFYRADPARCRNPGGTGLGLPIAQWIAEQHGGEVALESRPNQGTTATVRLPLCNCL